MIDEFENWLHKLYTTALLDDGLTGVLSDLAQAYPDLPLSYQAQCVYENRFYDCALYNVGTDAELKLAQAQSFNPFPPVALKCDLSDIARTADFISPEAVEKSDFYDEFLKHHGQVNRALGIVLHRNGEDSAFVAANLPKTMAMREEEHVHELFTFLRPHLQNAFSLLLEIKKRHAQLIRSDVWLDQIPTSACIVDPNGRIKHLNRLAEQMLKHSEILFTDRTVRLSARRNETQQILQNALFLASANGQATGPVSLTPDGEGGPLLFVMPLRHKDQVHPGLAPFLSADQPLLVTILDPDECLKKSEQALAAALGLTQRESLLVQELIQGASLREAADKLEISYFTARNHLASATSKTGSRSQSEIIRKGTQILSRLTRPRDEDEK